MKMPQVIRSFICVGASIVRLNESEVGVSSIAGECCSGRWRWQLASDVRSLKVMAWSKD